MRQEKIQHRIRGKKVARSISILVACTTKAQYTIFLQRVRVLAFNEQETISKPRIISVDTGFCVYAGVISNAIGDKYTVPVPTGTVIL